MCGIVSGSGYQHSSNSLKNILSTCGSFINQIILINQSTSDIEVFFFFKHRHFVFIIYLLLLFLYPQTPDYIHIVDNFRLTLCFSSFSGTYGSHLSYPSALGLFLKHLGAF